MKILLILAALLAAPPAGAESFQAWAARAARQEREKNDDLALQSYSNAITSWKDSDGKPARAKVYCARAALRDRRGDEAGALEDFSACLVVEKKNAKAFHRRGQLRFKGGQIDLAIDDFYKAVAIDIGFGQAYADRAKAYEKQGDKGFAAEDYRRACELKVKDACAKAKELAPARKGAKKKGSPEQAAAPEEDSSAAPAAPEAGSAPDEASAEGGAKAAKRSAKHAALYNPRFRDCLDALQACSDGGASFGGCVSKAPACEQQAVKGCCPGVCLQAYRKATNQGASEAAAFREIFAPDSSCAAPPKASDDED